MLTIFAAPLLSDLLNHNTWVLLYQCCNPFLITVTKIRPLLRVYRTFDIILFSLVSDHNLHCTLSIDNFLLNLTIGVNLLIVTG